ncbi:hypothetical protein [uncultured Fluviicola sp.]|uniref:hypothetical protein n=1 Tax=uncultured Fluviicola sp. TaxID=463303 RepID=UPI0025DA31B5|nr:hypothetical protein [uncultured Fluviicola sp.]
MKNNFKQNLRKFFLVVPMAASILACKKEKTPATSGAKAYPDEIVAGGSLPTEYEVVSWEPNDLLGWWDSTVTTNPCDLTGDGVPDISFIVSNQDTMGNLTEDGHSNATLSIETLNPDVYILTDADYVVPFNSGDSIHITDHWNQGVLTLLKRTYTCCPPTPHVYEGLWSNNVSNYVGVRYKNRLGWMRIMVVYNCALKTYSYGFSK